MLESTSPTSLPGDPNATGSSTPSTTATTPAASVTPMFSTVPAPSAPPPRPRADQDQEFAEVLPSTRQIIEVVAADGAVRARLKFFDTQKLTATGEICAAGEHTFAQRQAAMAQQRTKAEAYGLLFNEQLKILTDFRETCRVAFPNNTAALQALNVTEAVPYNLQKFLTHCRTAFTNAQKPEYNPALVEYGYTVARLDAELGAVNALDQADRDHATAASDAEAATAARDEAAAPVRALRGKVLRLARRQFRKEPELLRKLSF